MPRVHDSEFGKLRYPDGAAGLPVAPTVGSTSQALQLLDSGGANLLVGFRVTAGAPDDTVAGERLANMLGNAVQAGADSAVEFILQEGVTRVDVVGIMNGTAVNKCIDVADTAANAESNMVTFTFAASINKVVVSCTPAYGSGQYAQLSVEGFSYES